MAPNMNTPRIDSGGPLTAAELAAHNSAKQCPPCSGDCAQGRRCPAHAPAEACTDIGADDHATGDLAAAGLVVCVVSAIATVAGLWNLCSRYCG